MFNRLQLDVPSVASLALGQTSARAPVRETLGPNDIALLAELPPFLDRATIAAVARVRFGITASARSIERWPLQIHYLNGYATAKTADVLAFLAKMIEQAPAIPGGRTRKAAR